MANVVIIAVVISLVGLACILFVVGLVVFFLWWRKRNRQQEEYIPLPIHKYLEEKIPTLPPEPTETVIHEDAVTQCELFLRDIDCVLEKKLAFASWRSDTKLYFGAASNPECLPAKDENDHDLALTSKSWKKETNIYSSTSLLSFPDTQFVVTALEIGKEQMVNMKDPKLHRMFHEVITSISELSAEADENGMLLCPLLQTVSFGVRSQGVRPLSFFIRPRKPLGSLRDMLLKHKEPEIFQDLSNPRKSSKYQSFPLDYIREVTWLTLHALRYLRRLGFPPYASLHIGNVFVSQKPILKKSRKKASVQNLQILLSDYENDLLGLKPRYIHLIQAMSYMDSDIVALGVFLFEMSVSLVPQSVSSPTYFWPLSQHAAHVHPDIEEFLGRVFSPAAMKANLEKDLLHASSSMSAQTSAKTDSRGKIRPQITIKSLLKAPLFTSSLNLLLEEPIWPQPKLTKSSLTLLQHCRREERRRRAEGVTPSSALNLSWSAHQDIPVRKDESPNKKLKGKYAQSVGSSTHNGVPSHFEASHHAMASSMKTPSTLNSTMNATKKTMPPPPPRIPAVPKKSIPINPASDAAARSSLLSSIRGHKKNLLRSVQTIDKSQPYIR